jgi:hypothetical protein
MNHLEYSFDKRFAAEDEIWNFQVIQPRSMTTEAVFREFPSRTLRKDNVSSRNMPEIRLPVLTDSCRFRIFGGLFELGRILS